MIILFSGLIIGINGSQFAFAGGCVDNDGDLFFANEACRPNLDPDDNDPCIPDPNSLTCNGNSHVIGGKIIPVDSISLLLAGVQVNYSILTAIAVVGVGAGFGFLFFGNKLYF